MFLKNKITTEIRLLIENEHINCLNFPPVHGANIISHHCNQGYFWNSANLSTKRIYSSA